MANSNRKRNGTPNSETEGWTKQYPNGMHVNKLQFYACILQMRGLIKRESYKTDLQVLAYQLNTRKNKQTEW
jgi:hypothetical protein